MALLLPSFNSWLRNLSSLEHELLIRKEVLQKKIKGVERKNRWRGRRDQKETQGGKGRQ